MTRQCSSLRPCPIGWWKLCQVCTQMFTIHSYRQNLMMYGIMWNCSHSTPSGKSGPHLRPSMALGSGRIINDSLSTADWNPTPITQSTTYSNCSYCTPRASRTYHNWNGFVDGKPTCSIPPKSCPENGACQWTSFFAVSPTELTSHNQTRCIGMRSYTCHRAVHPVECARPTAHFNASEVATCTSSWLGHAATTTQ